MNDKQGLHWRIKIQEFDHLQLICMKHVKQIYLFLSLEAEES